MSPRLRNDDGRSIGSTGLALRVAGAWALVGIPLAWGVWQVIRRSLDLFR